ncbi:MAG: magnesium transporter [Clostridia bacterium]|nr:magnesium transporter [Clostridia bacterium]
MNENIITLCEQLNGFLESHNYRQFTELIDKTNHIDVAEYISELPDDKLTTAFRLLKKDVAADIFAELDTAAREKIILTTTDRDMALIVDNLFVDDAVDLLEELPASMVKRILRLATPETRALINKFLQYPEDSAGSVMTAEYIDLKKNMTVAAAVAKIRKTGVNKETVYTAFVVDSSRKLEGTVSLKDLLFADEEDIIGDIMTTDLIWAHTTDDKESVAALISKYDLLSLPITDNENRLVGIVTVDDAIDVIKEEATEDIEVMAAISPTAKSYMETTTFETWKKRIPWLLLLMVSSAFAGGIISHYESALGAYVILTSFIPMLMGSGGNAGGQSSVTIIRGISLGEIEFKDIFKVIFKEFKVSLLCAATMCVANFIKVMLIDFGALFSVENLIIAAVVSITLFCTIVVAKVIGAFLPLLVKKLGLDPAVMASPFITTIVDALSLVIYFRFATIFLNL